MIVEAEAAKPDVRQVLLASELNTTVTMSPDGASFAFVKTLYEGQELWLRDLSGQERRLAVHHGELLHDLRWTADGSVLLYRHTTRGRERWQLSGWRKADSQQLTIATRQTVIEYWTSRSDPGGLVYSSRTGPSPYSELFRASLADPAADPVPLAPNPGFHRWIVDGELGQRGGVRLLEDGSAQLVLGDTIEAARPVLTVSPESVPDLSVLRFSQDGTTLYVLTSSGGAARRLIAVDSGSAEVSCVFEHPSQDVEGYPIAPDGVWFDPATGRPDLCTVLDQRVRYHPLVPRLGEAVARLAATADRSVVLLDRSADDRTWLIVWVHSDGPITYHAYDPVTGGLRRLFVNRPELTGYSLPRLDDFRFAASDGLEITGYSMTPPGREGPLPTVVMVHGGPAGRDYWRFNPEAQYFASLGYLSLHVNYRGSRGFGTSFRLAGNGEWGGKMQDDVLEAVQAGIASGLIDQDRVAFFGASYGGYAALLAACRRPDLVRCAVAISPPCDLVTFTGKPPPYWQPLATLLRRQVLYSAAGRKLDEAELERRSPAHVLGASCAPLLIAHGARDPRIAVAEVDSFVARARGFGVPTRYLRFSDEGHQVRSGANRTVLFKDIEDFLEEHLASR